ncbi:MAG TPA: class I SAM-dependent methyltransferase [Candidatus Angelobacter sp.]|nr:class I SAM-dependent methyltransferase [Candidatus Angelobacter sp.]
MNYQDQERFFQGSRIWGGSLALAFVLLGVATRRTTGGRWSTAQTLIYLMVDVAVATLIYYTPDYLHLSVAPERKPRWETKIRWRIIGAVFLLGMLLASSNGGRVFVLLAVAWLGAANWLAAKKVPSRYRSTFLWSSDLALLFASLIRAGSASAAIALLLLAAAAHMAIVRREGPPLRWAIVAFSTGLIVLFFAAAPFSRTALLTSLAAFFVATAGTTWLVHRAQAQNERNVAAAMAELIEFTGYTADHIRHLWATSNQQLAANWEQAQPSEEDPAQMAEWYRQNSELYLFAISAYNLEYKRIRSNMKVLRLARGATLDYGAGNGEILLELARRGHRVAYYDVDGVTMRFARHRAERQGLSIDFFHSKDALAAAANGRGFDTIFSFDVLEHLPDLPGELNFLSSMLRPGGIFVFDVPAGSTRAHPMHLNHDLNVLSFMGKKGLADQRGLMLRLPLRKEEKFVFRAAGDLSTRSAG